MNSKQLKKYGGILASIILCIFSLQQKVVAQADFRNDNYILTENYWKEASSNERILKTPKIVNRI